MKYFLDTEFLEGTQKKWFGKTKPTIDLISIGIVSEEGKEYYAISKDFNLKEAWNRYDLKNINDPHKQYPSITQRDYWIRDNVLLPIYNQYIIGDMKNRYTFSYSTMKWILKNHGKSNTQIANEIKQYIAYSELPNLHPEDLIYTKDTTPIYKQVEFYTYYGDYDWVAFCWLFGKMIDLPKGFPMYSKDLKQEFDNLVEQYHKENPLPKDNFFDWKNQFKISPEYPKQENEHNALADAKWNKKLYEFIISKL